MEVGVQSNHRGLALSGHVQNQGIGGPFQTQVAHVLASNAMPAKWRTAERGRP